MFRTPSSRRKSEQQDLTINLVPMLDALVTMVSFLLMTMGYMAISVIETPAPMVAPADQQKEKLEKDPPLQLTAEIMNEQILIHDWTGSRENHTIAMIDDPTQPGQKIYDTVKLHALLMEIKARHPKERQIILKPEKGVSYDSIIGIMDASRFFDKTDTVPPNVTEKDVSTGSEMPSKNLFPDVVFGNILST